MTDAKEIRLEEMWPLMSEQLARGKMVRFAPKGTSMLPMIRQNEDTVVIKRVHGRLKKYDVPLYRRKNGQFVLHRVVGFAKDGSYIMCGDNQYARESGITDEDILAVTDGYYSGGNYVSCNDANYMRYAKKQVRKQSLRRYFIKFKSLIKAILKKILKF